MPDTKPRSVLLLPAAMLICLLAGACSRLPVTNDPADGDSSAVAAAVKVIDVTSPMQLTSYDGQDTWTFTGAETESLAAGQILVSVKNDGYLLRIDSVSVSGAVTAVTGSPVSLEDVIESCDIDTQADLTTDTVVFTAEPVHAGYLSGVASMAPHVSLGMTVTGHTMTRFAFSAAGRMQVSLVCTTGTGQAGPQSVSLYNDAFPVVLWIGDVPILAVLDLGVTGTMAGTPGTEALAPGIIADLIYDGMFETDLTFDGTSWLASGTCDTAFSAAETILVNELADSLEFRINTQLRLRIFNTAGPALTADVYGLLKRDGSVDWNVYGGIHTAVSVPTATNIAAGAGACSETIRHARLLLRQGTSAGGLPPSAPTPLTPANATLNLTAPVTFTWSDAASAEWYVVNIAEKSSYDTVYTPALTVSDLDPMTKYHWRVQAGNTWGAGDWSATRYFSTTGPAPVTLEPTGGETLSYSVILFKWTSVSGAADYTVTFGRTADFSGNDVQSIQSGGETAVAGTLATAAATAGTVVYWKAKALAAYSESPWSAVDSFIIQPPVQLAAPVPLSPVEGAPAKADTGVVLNWSLVPEADSYELQTGKDSTFTEVLQAPSDIAATHYRITGLPTMTTIYWRVRAYIDSEPGPWSDKAYFTTK